MQGLCSKQILVNSEGCNVGHCWGIFDIVCSKFLGRAFNVCFASDMYGVSYSTAAAKLARKILRKY